MCFNLFRINSISIVSIQLAMFSISIENRNSNFVNRYFYIATIETEEHVLAKSKILFPLPPFFFKMTYNLFHSLEIPRLISSIFTSYFM